MIWFLIIVVAFIAAFCLLTGYDKCPREIRGYRCRGRKCDHSSAAVAQAKEDMDLGR